jgi:hypothetical protein
MAVAAVVVAAAVVDVAAAAVVMVAARRASLCDFASATASSSCLRSDSTSLSRRINSCRNDFCAVSNVCSLPTKLFTSVAEAEADDEEEEDGGGKFAARSAAGETKTDLEAEDGDNTPEAAVGFVDVDVDVEDEVVGLLDDDEEDDPDPVTAVVVIFAPETAFENMSRSAANSAKIYYLKAKQKKNSEFDRECEYVILALCARCGKV